MKKLEFIHARVSKEESDLLNLIAVYKGANLSETIRYLIRGEIERNGLLTDSVKSTNCCSQLVQKNNNPSTNWR